MLRAETPRADTPGRRVPLWIWNIGQISKEHFTLEGDRRTKGATKSCGADRWKLVDPKSGLGNPAVEIWLVQPWLGA